MTPPGSLQSLIHGIRRLFHRLAALADAVHADLGITAGQRAVLEALHQAGPRSVPALAREKSVTRQHVQVLANSLTAAGLVAPDPNPAHRRSPLLRLTREGRRTFDRMQAREEALLAVLASRLPPVRIAQGTAALHALGAALDAAGAAGELPSTRRRPRRRKE